MSDADLAARLHLPRFPRSAAYDPEWMLQSAMGPNAVWLAEWLCEAMPLEPGMRVLDLGCGRAATSIFLAREFGVDVWAADLWIPPSENQARVGAAGLGAHVFPLRMEAHDIPFPDGFFDAVVSIDAYHYFGTDDLYIGAISRHLQPGGRIGIAVPGAAQELDVIPEQALPYWQWEFVTFHTPAWWRRHWEKTGLVEVEVADWLEDGWRWWLHWNEVCADHGIERNRPVAAKEAEMLRADAGRTFGFVRMVARKP